MILEQGELPELNVGSYMVNAEIVLFVITPNRLLVQLQKHELKKEHTAYVQIVEIEFRL